MAKRARRQAEILGGQQRDMLLDRAAEYEMRAKRLESSGKSSSPTRRQDRKDA